uniref:Uncharacterized protein LOC116941354 n=1 Tax=Petromyzon marinus TaxID=7757 RepID=A0AAJ7WTN4_PETMA|nr:uncharacterized protein LOC116941354 [Petromyzon marinus]
MTTVAHTTAEFLFLHLCTRYPSLTLLVLQYHSRAYGEVFPLPIKRSVGGTPLAIHRNFENKLSLASNRGPRVVNCPTPGRQREEAAEVEWRCGVGSSSATAEPSSWLTEDRHGCPGFCFQIWAVLSSHSVPSGCSVSPEHLVTAGGQAATCTPGVSPLTPSHVARLTPGSATSSPLSPQQQWRWRSWHESDHCPSTGHSQFINIDSFFLYMCVYIYTAFLRVNVPFSMLSRSSYVQTDVMCAPTRVAPHEADRANRKCRGRTRKLNVKEMNSSPVQVMRRDKGTGPNLSLYRGEVQAPRV